MLEYSADGAKQLENPEEGKHGFLKRDKALGAILSESKHDDLRFISWKGVLPNRRHQQE